ncbi:hypothetical protein BVRB_8g201630 isoform A [Beta vulgaris subsp. vulgaris]|uniref:Uncharacterized protein n=1 Tax=Beta vulgaris subsp. vulgaris TaxID=3555 RepID=A0A0J8B9D5_BETVV|nr:hypothetical protein BVRB_8g201630 isoform A [Beta vulgaris subsp. vulgaris]
MLAVLAYFLLKIFNILSFWIKVLESICGGAMNICVL